MQSARKTKSARSLYHLRLQAILHYGPNCACCGESKAIFLTLDHISPIGKERVPLNAELASLRANGWPQGEHQVLCYNCNLAKRDNPAGCPCQYETEDVLGALEKLERSYIRPNVAKVVH